MSSYLHKAYSSCGRCCYKLLQEILSLNLLNRHLYDCSFLLNFVPSRGQSSQLVEEALEKLVWRMSFDSVRCL